MRGFLHDVRRYLRFSREEWLSLAITAGVGGLLLTRSLFYQPGDTYDVALAGSRLVMNVVAVSLLLLLQVYVTKLAGVRFGVEITYEKYALGLLVGGFITFLSFGFLPFFVTGRFHYRAIPNLRVGKFRGSQAKHWEIGLSLVAGILALLLVTIPLGFLELASGFALFRSFIVAAVLLAVYAMLPLPLIETSNPYTVYMSRIESLEGCLPGYDIFLFSRFWFFLLAGLTLGFAAFSLLFTPSFFGFGLALLLGVAAVFLYQKTPILYAG